MSESRVLVVRSGAESVPLARRELRRVEVVERSSHAIENVEVPAGASRRDAADLVLFTSQVAVERVADGPAPGVSPARPPERARASPPSGP